MDKSLKKQISKLDKEHKEALRKDSAEGCFERWKFYIGVENIEGLKLTEEQLRKWSEDPNRKVQCIFCGHELPYDSWYCPLCKEYKGITPYVEGWSYYKE